MQWAKNRNKRLLKKKHGSVPVKQSLLVNSARNAENLNRYQKAGHVLVALSMKEISVQIAARKNRRQLLFISVAIVAGRQKMHHVFQDSVQTAENRSIVKSKEGYKCRE